MVAQNPDFAGQTLAVDFAGVADSAHYLFGTDDLRTQFFTGLGFAVAETSTPVSQEQLPLLDQDVLIGGGYTKEEGAADPLFARLAVVSEDRTVYFGDYDTDLMGALGYGSPLSLPYLLDEVVPALQQAADGDPATAVEPIALSRRGPRSTDPAPSRVSDRGRHHRGGHQPRAGAPRPPDSPGWPY